MNRPFIPVATALGTSSLLLVDSAVKGGAILLFAAVVALMFRRSSAATRHLVWLVAIVAMLVVPLCSALLPQWHVLPSWARIAPAPVPVNTAAPVMVTRDIQPVRSLQNVPVSQFEPPPESIQRPVDEPTGSLSPEFSSHVTSVPVESAGPHWLRLNTLPILWVVGFALLMLRLLAARLMLWSNERRASLLAVWDQSAEGGAVGISGDRLANAFQTACQQLGVRRRIRLLMHAESTIPVVWGLVHYRLLLPAAARQWSAEQLQSVLLHELAHIQRRDMVAQLLAQIACALHWFNPLVWFASWRLHVERERACDDLVLSRGVPASTYAEHLLDVATRLSSPRWTQVCGLAMARTTSLEGRLRAVLSQHHNRRSVTTTIAVSSLVLGAGLAIPIAMLSAAAASDTTVADPATVAGESDTPERKEKAQSGKSRDRNTVALLSRWQSGEGNRTTIPESCVKQVRVAIDKWITLPSAKPYAASVAELRPWQLNREQHPIAEVAGWLDNISAIHPGALAFAVSSETVHQGRELSEEQLADLKFGAPAANGLRAAWRRYPNRHTYLRGDVVHSGLVIQNTSAETVEFQCPYSLNDIVSWVATADGDRKVDTRTSVYTGTFPLITWQLPPGTVAEITRGHVTAIGQKHPSDGDTIQRASTVLLAQPGECISVHWNVREPIAMTTPDVTFTVLDIEDVTVWSTSQAGQWPLVGGATLEVKQRLVHGSDISSTAVITWPTNASGETARHEFWLAGDAFAVRHPWLLAWERRSHVLWAMSGHMQSSGDFHRIKPIPGELRRIDFSDPEKITDTRWNDLPEDVPAAIQSEFLREFQAWPTTSPTAALAGPRVSTCRAEDTRPVTELLTGTWTSLHDDVDVSITFPAQVDQQVTWSIRFDRNSGGPGIQDSLTRLDLPSENEIRLTKVRLQPKTPGTAELGKLKRGIGDTLLLDISPHVDYPEYERVYGVVLTRAPASAAASAPKPAPAAAPATASARAPAAASAASPQDQTSNSGKDLPVVNKPKTEEAAALFDQWLRYARTDGRIPGALIGKLGTMVRYFISLNKDEAPALTKPFEAMLPRFDATHDWAQSDAVALLDDVAAVHRIPLNNSLDAASQRSIHLGRPLPPELADAPWGTSAPNGLRVAWLLEPQKSQYRLGAQLGSRILVHNSGSDTVFFNMPSWQQSSAHAAHDADGTPIRVNSTYWTTRAQKMICRLAPGTYLETPAAGIGVGASSNQEDWANVRPGAWIHADEGDDVRFTPGPVEVRYSPTVVGTRIIDGKPDNVDPKDAAALWDRILSERIACEMPIPTSAPDRRQLFRRVTQELFGVPPTDSEIDAFVSDNSPAALDPVTSPDLLKTRLMHGRNISSFTGTLPSGDIHFHVLAADPHASTRPRVVTGPGYYILAGQHRLHVQRSRDGNRHTNKATIRFQSSAAGTKPQPYEISLPDNDQTWALGWAPDSPELWITEKDRARKVEFAGPDQVKEIPLHKPFRDQIPSAVFEALTSAIRFENANRDSVKLSDAMEGKLKWGEAVNGLRAAVIIRHSSDSPQAGQIPDLYIAVQNVSDAPIRFNDTQAELKPRMVYVRIDGRTQMGMGAAEPKHGDVVLQPRHVTYVLMYSSGIVAEGRTTGNYIVEGALKDTHQTLIAHLQIEKAPPGAWTGKLVTGETGGAAAVETLQPEIDSTQTLP